MANKAAIELETVIIFIIVLVVLVFVVLMFTKYGSSLLESLKGSTTNVISLANNTITKLPGQ